MLCLSLVYEMSGIAPLSTSILHGFGGVRADVSAGRADVSRLGGNDDGPVTVVPHASSEVSIAASVGVHLRRLC